MEGKNQDRRGIYDDDTYLTTRNLSKTDWISELNHLKQHEIRDVFEHPSTLTKSMFLCILTTL